MFNVQDADAAARSGANSRGWNIRRLAPPAGRMGRHDRGRVPARRVSLPDLPAREILRPRPQPAQPLSYHPACSAPLAVRLAGASLTSTRSQTPIAGLVFGAGAIIFLPVL